MSLADDLAKLEELRRGGALSESEFSRAKAALLADAAGGAKPSATEEHLAGHLAEIHYQNELARIDREWEIERQQYLIPDRWGRRIVPTPGMGIGIALVGGVFGVIWTVMAVAITGSAPDVGPFSVAKVAFPLFGVVFIVAAIGFGLYAHARASKYQAAFAAYQERRAAVKPG